MKRFIAITSILLMIVSVNAQPMAHPTRVENKDIYVLSIVNEEFISVGNVNLTDQEIANTNSIEERIKLFVNKASTQSFDAIMTRTGNSATLIKYKNPTSNVTAKPTDSFEKVIYFLSTPTKKYSVIDEKILSSEEIILPFNQLISNAIKAVNKPFDAVMIKNNKVEYLLFN